MVKLADVKVGDKVRVYDGMSNPVGLVKSIEYDENTLYVENCGWHHVKQCRKLKVKPKSAIKIEDLTFEEAIEYLKNNSSTAVTCYGDNVYFFLSQSSMFKYGDDEINIDTSLVLKVKTSDGRIREWRPTSEEILERKYRVIR